LLINAELYLEFTTKNPGPSYALNPEIWPHFKNICPSLFYAVVYILLFYRASFPYLKTLSIAALKSGKKRKLPFSITEQTLHAQ